MTSGAQKHKEKAQQQFQSSAAKSREASEFFAASITPTNNNLAEKSCNALLVIIQLQMQGFLAFAAANLLNISSKNQICHHLEIGTKNQKFLENLKSAA